MSSCCRDRIGTPRTHNCGIVNVAPIRETADGQEQPARVAKTEPGEYDGRRGRTNNSHKVDQ
jgi:hypothetical protein